MRDGRDLLIVDDAVEGGYFRVRLPGTLGTLIDLDKKASLFIPLSSCALANDLEGIDALADGRVVVLWERLRSLIDSKGVVVEYPEMFSEYGGRGLEGVAVRPLGDGSTRVVVVWEGGYPELSSLPQQLKQVTGDKAMKPVTLHNLTNGAALLSMLLGSVYGNQSSAAERDASRVSESGTTSAFWSPRAG